MLAELAGEAVARPLRRGALAAERVAQRGVLADEADGARPRRQCVAALDERHPDQRPRRVAVAPRHAQGVQPHDLRGVEESSIWSASERRGTFVEAT